MGEPLVRFPVVCPDCLREHLASVPVDVVAAALAASCTTPREVGRPNLFSRGATQAAVTHLHEYLAAIIRCPVHQSRFSTTLGMRAH
jgi:hypothetical protein